jgi:hypothetical protein
LRYSGSTCLPILSICITVQQAKHEKILPFQVMVHCYP